MLNFLKAKVAGVIAITTMVWPAYAQFGQFDPNTILAKDLRPLAGYYAPYGMLALTPYYRGHLAKGDNAQAVVNSMFKPENFDVNYIIAQSKSEGHSVTLTDIVNGAMAPDALGPWHYEFGSNAKDVCYDGEFGQLLLGTPSPPVATPLSRTDFSGLVEERYIARIRPHPI